MTHTGGNWDPKDKHCYFIAGSIDTFEVAAPLNSNLLIAVNEIGGDEELDKLVAWADQGKKVFIDSGVFNLANSHARNHDMRMDEALCLAPSELDGFDTLFEKYCRIMTKLGDKVWGYIEIDQGGRENKLKTRAKLEGMGFRPIPVYHPFGDGWDYFDYLGQNYDRICFGNIVQADRETRKRFMATAWERRRKYPNLWIHLLGLTANEIACNAYPPDSCDSSTWLNLVRWPDSFRSRVGGQSFSTVKNVAYQMGADPESEIGHLKSRRLGSYDAEFITKNWHGINADWTKSLVADTHGYIP